MAATAANVGTAKAADDAEGPEGATRGNRQEIKQVAHCGNKPSGDRIEFWSPVTVVLKGVQLPPPVASWKRKSLKGAITDGRLLEAEGSDIDRGESDAKVSVPKDIINGAPKDLSTTTGSGGTLSGAWTQRSSAAKERRF